MIGPNQLLNFLYPYISLFWQELCYLIPLLCTSGKPVTVTPPARECETTRCWALQAGMRGRGHYAKYFDKRWSPVHMWTSSSYFVSRDDKNMKRLPWQENEGLSVRAKGVCIMGARCFYFFVPWQLQNTKLCFQEMKSILGACVWHYVAECHLFPSQVTWGCY